MEPSFADGTLINVIGYYKNDVKLIAKIEECLKNENNLEELSTIHIDACPDIKLDSLDLFVHLFKAKMIAQSMLNIYYDKDNYQNSCKIMNFGDDNILADTTSDQPISAILQYVILYQILLKNEVDSTHCIIMNRKCRICDSELDDGASRCDICDEAVPSLRGTSSGSLSNAETKYIGEEKFQNQELFQQNPEVNKISEISINTSPIDNTQWICSYCNFINNSTLTLCKVCDGNRIICTKDGNKSDFKDTLNQSEIDKTDNYDNIINDNQSSAFDTVNENQWDCGCCKSKNYVEAIKCVNCDTNNPLFSLCQQCNVNIIKNDDCTLCIDCNDTDKQPNCKKVSVDEGSKTSKMYRNEGKESKISKVNTRWYCNGEKCKHANDAELEHCTSCDLSKGENDKSKTENEVILLACQENESDGIINELNIRSIEVNANNFEEHEPKAESHIMPEVEINNVQIDKSQWICPNCTLVNESSHICCTACFGNRIDNVVITVCTKYDNESHFKDTLDKSKIDSTNDCANTINDNQSSTCETVNENQWDCESGHSKNDVVAIKSINCDTNNSLIRLCKQCNFKKTRNNDCTLCIDCNDTYKSHDTDKLPKEDSKKSTKVKKSKHDKTKFYNNAAKCKNDNKAKVKHGKSRDFNKAGGDKFGTKNTALIPPSIENRDDKMNKELNVHNVEVNPELHSMPEVEINNAQIDKSQWICPKCTYTNESSLMCCDACFVNRIDNLVSPVCTKDDNKSHFKGTLDQSKIDKTNDCENTINDNQSSTCETVNENQWHCGSCHSKNYVAAIKCINCDTNNPLLSICQQCNVSITRSDDCILCIDCNDKCNSHDTDKLPKEDSKKSTKVKESKHNKTKWYSNLFHVISRDLIKDGGDKFGTKNTALIPASIENKDDEMNKELNVHKVEANPELHSMPEVEINNAQIDKPRWICPKCTYVNESSFLSCSICYAPRLDNGEETINVNQWDCRNCLNKNYITALKCSKCLKNNPLLNLCQQCNINIIMSDDGQSCFDCNNRNNFTIKEQPQNVDYSSNKSKVSAGKRKYPAILLFFSRYKRWRCKNNGCKATNKAELEHCKLCGGVKLEDKRKKKKGKLWQCDDASCLKKNEEIFDSCQFCGQKRSNMMTTKNVTSRRKRLLKKLNLKKASRGVQKERL